MRYVITVHEDSFAYEESYRVESDSPFPPMNIGNRWDSDFNNNAKWNTPLEMNESYVITDIERQIGSGNDTVLYALTKIKLGIKSRKGW